MLNERDNTISKSSRKVEYKCKSSRSEQPSYETKSQQHQLHQQGTKVDCHVSEGVLQACTFFGAIIS